MKRIIRLTESELHDIIKESVKRIMNEDGEGSAMGGGATSDAGLNAKEKLKVHDKLIEENSKEVADKKKITKLMFEQMLRGLYLTTFQNN